MKAPGSPNCVAPRTRNSIASSVLPQPGPPQISVGRPLGSPPPVISSRPAIPVGTFGSLRVSAGRSIFMCFSALDYYMVITRHDGKSCRATPTYRGNPYARSSAEKLARGEGQGLRAERFLDPERLVPLRHA